MSLRKLQYPTRFDQTRPQRRISASCRDEPGSWFALFEDTQLADGRLPIELERLARRRERREQQRDNCSLSRPAS